MKLNKVQARGFIGARDIDIEIPTPILVVAGDNESGKSSMYEAITLAATGEMARVKLKKEYGEVVSDGVKSGQIFVDFSDGPASFEVPSGKWGESKSLTTPAMRYCLNANRFASLDETERRRFLFALSGKSPSKEEVSRRLRQRNISVAVIEQALPLLSRGFDVAAKECARIATETKGSWRECTGEAYGATKAENWRCDVPDYDDDAFVRLSAKLTSVRAERTEAITAHGRLQGLAESALRNENRIADLRGKLGKKKDLEKRRGEIEKEISTYRSKLATSTALLNEIVAKIAAAESPIRPAKAAMQAPVIIDEPPELLVDAVGALRELVETMEGSEGVSISGNVAEWAEYSFPDDAMNVLQRFDAIWPDYGIATTAPEPELVQEASPAVTEDLQAKRRKAAADVQAIDDKLQAAEMDLRALDTDLGAMAAHQAQLDELTLSDKDSTPTAADIAAARAKVTALDDKVSDVELELGVLQKTRDSVNAAHEKTDRAADLHAKVGAWDACAKALAPDGIPAEIVAEALEPLNDELATIASQSAWPPVTIDASMTIRYGGRRYELLAESGKWRADACLAAMIAAISGTRFIMLDRVDVNSITNRSKLLRWIGTAVRTGSLEGACLMGTFKAPPTGLPAQLFTTAWLENGKNVQ